MIDLTTIDDNKEQEAMYLYKWLLKGHDWYWRSSDDGRFLSKWMEREKQIERLRESIDPTNIVYNQYSPYKK